LMIVRLLMPIDLALTKPFILAQKCQNERFLHEYGLLV